MSRREELEREVEAARREYSEALAAEEAAMRHTRHCELELDRLRSELDDLKAMEAKQ